MRIFLKKAHTLIQTSNGASSMLNYLWGFMMIIGIAYGAVQGKMTEVTNGILSSAQEAVTLCITMIGIMSVWVGLMEIAKTSGLNQSATRRIQPLIRFLFPDIPQGHPAREHITTNIIANLLGLGWAATPAGLKAMEALAQLETERGNPEYLSNKKNRTASAEMCTFLVINISSLQLIPVNIIAYRAQYGSVNPADILLPAIISTSVSTLAGIIFCKLLPRR